MYRTGRILILSTEEEADLLRRDFTPVSVEINKRPYLQAMGEGVAIDWCTNTANFSQSLYARMPKPDAVFFTGRMSQHRDKIPITVGNPDDMGRLLKALGVKDYAKMEMDDV